MARRRLIVDDEYNVTVDHMYRNSRHVYEYPSVISTTSVSVTDGLMRLDNYSYRHEGGYIRNLTHSDSAYALQFKTDTVTNVQLYYSSMFVIMLVILFLLSY